MRKPILIVIGVIAVALIGVPLALSFYLPSYARQKTLLALNGAGFGAASFESFETGHGKVTLKKVKLDDKGFSTAEKIESDYSLTGFFTGKPIKTLTVEGLSLTGEYSKEKKLTLAGWTQENKIELSKLPAIKTIEIKNGRIDLMTDALGGVNVKFDILMRQTTLGSIEFKSTLSGTQRVFSADANLNGTIKPSGQWNADLEINDGKIDLPLLKATRVSGTGTLSGDPKKTPEFNLQLSAGGVNLFNLPWHNVSATAQGNTEHYAILSEGKSVGLEGIEFSLNIPDGLKLSNMSGSLHTQKLSDLFSFMKTNKVLPEKTSFPSFFDYLGPLSLDLQTHRNDALSMQVTDIAYTIHDEKGMMNVEGNAKTDTQAKAIDGTFSMPKTSLNSPAKGGISLNGKFRTDYKSGTVKTKGVLEANLKDAAFRAGPFYFKNVNADFSFDDLASFSTDEKRKVTFALPLKDSVKQSGIASISIQKGDKIHIEDPAFEIFGGKITAADQTLTKGKGIKNTTLVLSGISLGDVSTSLTIDGLSMEGRLKGSLPIKFKEGKAYIEDGVLSNDGAGTIYYSPSKIPAFLQGEDMSLETARMALENYSFDLFEIRLNGPLEESMNVTINARGYNPGLLEKRPIAINLNTTAALGPLFSNILEAPPGTEENQ